MAKGNDRKIATTNTAIIKYSILCHMVIAMIRVAGNKNKMGEKPMMTIAHKIKSNMLSFSCLLQKSYMYDLNQLADFDAILLLTLLGVIPISRNVLHSSVRMSWIIQSMNGLIDVD